jgi:mRNA interferase MazF
LKFLYRQKDIVLVPFPFTNATTAKQRPVLIVSSDEINQSSTEDFIGLAVTSVLHGSKYSIAITSKNDCEKGYLPKDSEIQCNKIATIQKDLTLKKICTLKQEAYQKVVDKIKQSLHIK